jgi:hypothetical protein
MWDIAILVGVFGLFFTLFLLFIRFAPMIAAWEVKSVAVDQSHTGGHAAEGGHHG